VAGGGIVVIGEADEVDLYALAGADVVVAADFDSVQAAWGSLPPETALVVLTARAARFIERESGGWGLPLVAVMGE
jgi:hypothetical protein